MGVPRHPVEWRSPTPLWPLAQGEEDDAIVKRPAILRFRKPNFMEVLMRLRRESIQIILLTEFEERLKLPDFGGGLRTFLFEPNTTSPRRLIEERVVQALGRWEPRIRLESVAVDPDPEDDQLVSVVIQYRLVADGTLGQVGLGIRLEGQP